MIVCLCKGINDKVIKIQIKKGCSSLKQLQLKTGACTDCKICAITIKKILEKNK